MMKKFVLIVCVVMCCSVGTWAKGGVSPVVKAVNGKQVDVVAELCRNGAAVTRDDVAALNAKALDVVMERLLEEGKYEDLVVLLDVLLKSGVEERMVMEWGSAKAVVLQDCVGDYGRAEEVYEWLLPMAKRVLGEENMDCEEVVNNAATLYGDWGKYDKAEVLLKEAIAIAEKVVGKEHVEYAYAVNNLAVLYEEMGRYDEVEGLAREALKIYEKRVGKKDPLYAAPLRTIANLKIRQGLYLEALPLSAEATEIYRNAGDEEAYNYAASLTTDAIIKADVGDFEESERLYLLALDVKRAVLGENHIDYAMGMEDLGGLYVAMGRYKKAEDLLQRSLAIYKKTEGTESVDYGWCLQSLGDLHSDLADYERAKNEYTEALSVWEKTAGKGHQNYAQTLANLALVNRDGGDLDEAMKLYDKVLSGYAESVGERHPEYASVLQNLAICYVYKEDFVAADSLIKKAKMIVKETLGEEHPYYVTALGVEGYVNYKKGDYATAESCYLRAIELEKRVFGDEHVLYEKEVYNLSVLYVMTGEYEKAKPYVEESFRVKKKLINGQFSFLSEREREVFYQRYSDALENVYPLYVHKCSKRIPGVERLAYNNALFMKGLLLSTTTRVQEAALESGDENLKKKWMELKELKQYLNLIQYKSKEEQERGEVKEMMARAEELDKELTKGSEVYREEMMLKEVTVDDVQRGLKENEVAVEFVNFDYETSKKKQTVYSALLLEWQGEPQMIPLFYLATNSIEGLHTLANSDKKMMEVIWEKVVRKVKEGSTIYFSPSGVLHQVALEALPIDGEKTMMDVYNMVRLSSTREIVRLEHEKRCESATLYGGLVYNVTADKLRAESKKYKTSDLIAMRGVENDIDRGNVQYLPGTMEEVKSIEKLLKQNKVKVQTYTSTMGNEESFKALSGQHRNVLHIATHGFYWNDSVAQERNYIAQRLAVKKENAVAEEIDPLNRCGLLMAGANIALSGDYSNISTDVQDGILTAKEISFLDLSGAEVVVLSACETARGDVTSEGVYGLQRAFKQAGVQTIVMSLWPVGDKVTQMLMTEFYRNWITLGKNRREAFREAQNKVRESYPDIQSWGGFIMQD